MTSTLTGVACNPRTGPDHASIDTSLDMARASLRVFIMDLWCYTPHYDRYLCESLTRADMEVTLGAVSPYQDPNFFVRSGLRNAPGFVDVVPRLRVSSDSIRRSLMLVESCLNMIALLFRFAVSKPDVVHVQWIPLVRRLPFEIWFLKLLKRMEIKLVYTVHNVLPHDTGNRFTRTFKRVYGEMDALVCHTLGAKNRLVSEFSVNPERVWVIPHGPLLHDSKRCSREAARTALSLPTDKTLVLWQGIVRPYKGLDFLLEAWRQMDARSLNANLIIAGTGDPKLLHSLEDQVARLGLLESVRLDLRFLPEEELSMYYQACDIAVYPYKEVTTSGALMTAMAFQKPIVATKLPAFQEVLEDKKTALLVEYGNTASLARALNLLIRDPQERERLSLGVSFLESRNSWSRVAKTTRQCYASVL